MAIPTELSKNPYDILNPDHRWHPGPEQLQNMPIGHLLPPLVDKVRRAVQKWRNDDYSGVSDTSRALLHWWFCRDKEELGQNDIRYYFAQRETVESVIYLCEHETGKILDKYELLRYSSGGVTPEMMAETWRRFVIKMATGSGKTKVMSLLILWSYFHKTYEPDSPMSRNILLIAPNIIVLDRLYRDFTGMRIFTEDGALPENGYKGHNWQNDFQLRLHVQDDVRGAQTVGNLYLTNIHRVYNDDVTIPTPDDEDASDYFIGERAADIRTSGIDLGQIVRDTRELLIINDEAHHIHDSRGAWFGAIENIRNLMVHNGSELSLQLDLTATPKHNNGAIFPQTISDYPLVEAIHQNIVKRPVVPDEQSEQKMKKRTHTNYGEQHADYIELGVKEWRKARDEHKKAGKNAILFVMTNDTKNCDELAEYLQNRYNDLEGKVLVIHTKQNGEISEAPSGKKEKELIKLRKAASDIDETGRYSAVVSVLVLREGWDVRNVTTIVGLRAYTAKSQILPEQTLGRGLRLMYDGAGEKLSVIGTPAFHEFVKEIEREGVKIERVAMNDTTPAQAPRIITIDRENPQKDIGALDIEVPILSRRYVNDFSQIMNLKAADIEIEPAQYNHYNKPDEREIVFRDVLTNEISHKTSLGDGLPLDYSNVIAYFVRCLQKQFNLFSGYDFLYSLTEEFVRDYLFGETVPLDSKDTLRNLAEISTTKKLLDAMGTAIGKAIRKETDETKITGAIKISDMRTFIVDSKREYYPPIRNAQNYIVGDSGLEIDFAKFLDSCGDVVTHAMNYLAVGFYVDYVREDGVISRYFPDFFVRDDNGKLWVVETKGRMDENDRRKLKRLAKWRDDVSRLMPEAAPGCLLVKDAEFKQYRPQNFAQLAEMFLLREDEL